MKGGSVFRVCARVLNPRRRLRRRRRRRPSWSSAASWIRRFSSIEKSCSSWLTTFSSSSSSSTIFFLSKFHHHRVAERKKLSKFVIEAKNLFSSLKEEKYFWGWPSRKVIMQWQVVEVIPDDCDIVFVFLCVRTKWRFNICDKKKFLKIFNENFHFNLTKVRFQRFWTKLENVKEVKILRSKLTLHSSGESTYLPPPSCYLVWKNIVWPFL